MYTPAVKHIYNKFCSHEVTKYFLLLLWLYKSTETLISHRTFSHLLSPIRAPLEWSKHLCSITGQRKSTR